MESALAQAQLLGYSSILGGRRGTLMRNILGGLRVAGAAGLCGSAGLAQTRPDLSSAEGAAKFVMSLCEGWRVSEIPKGSRVRKPLGKATDALCRDAAERWSGRLVESHQAKDGSGPLRAIFEICGGLAEKLAGRPVEMFSCSSWSKRPGPPDEIWAALDGSPVEGIGVKKSTRDELLRHVFERRLSKDWDQVQVKTDMEAIGFACGVPDRKGGRDPLITSMTPQFTCAGDTSNLVGAPSKPLFLFGLQINVTLKFAESGGPRGWQSIEVKTSEAHL
jgi:hypothetical protein